MSSLLTKHAMLVKLTIRQWDGFKKDKRAADRVDSEFKTAGNAGNYNKRLIDKEILKPIKNVASRLRKEHELRTHPFAYEGMAVLPLQLLFDWRENIALLKDGFDMTVDNFATQYPVHVANQAKKLGDLFDPTDYPGQDEIRSKFGVEFSYWPMPATDHFMADLEEGIAKEIKKSMERELGDVQRNVVQNLYDRVTSMVEHMHERLADPANGFHSTLVTNLEELVSVLPALNIFHDPLIEQATREIKQKLLIADAQDLKADPELRQAVAESAFDIVSLLKGEMTYKEAA